MTQQLNEDELIKSLVPDPSQLPDVKARVGWLGKSTREGKWRLYLNAQLNSYIEFSETDVVHTVSLASDLNPIGGTLVYLQRQAELMHTRTTSSQTQAEWLSGDITTEYLRRTAAAGIFTSTGGGIQPFNPLWTITVTVTIIIAATTYAISEALDCPNPNNSAGLCPTRLSACC
jgi:hypothetical protein